MGLLGSYNKWLKSPFETFYVGGDGMSGSYTYATETIGLAQSIPIIPTIGR